MDRRRELALLDDTFQRVKVRERAHLVTLLGEPGIGKTRVVEEFLGGLSDDVRVLTGRSSPFEEEVTFWPLAQMIYREIGAERDAPGKDVADRLRSLVSEWVAPEDADDAARRLALTLGVEEGEGSEEGRYQAAEVRAGVLSLLTGLASRGPVVLVFDDLHEADPLLLDLIEQLVKEARRVPLMVLCVARWEFLEDRPNWAGGIADAVTLWVEPLTPGNAARARHGSRRSRPCGGRARGPARRRQPILRGGDRGHDAPRGARPAPARARRQRPIAAAHGAGGRSRPGSTS